MWQIYHSVVLCILCAVIAFLFFNSAVVITVSILVLAGVIAFHDFPLKDFSFHVASLKCWVVTLCHCVLNMYNQSSQTSGNQHMFSDNNGVPSSNIGLFNRKNRNKSNYNLYTVKNDSQLSQTYNSPVTYSMNSSAFSVTKQFSKTSDSPKSYGHIDVSISRSPKLRSPSISPSKNDNSKNQTPVSPLVSSSRYNATLDPKLYADVSSPGFCGRVAQKLSEAKTHQTKYGAVGVFPVVNLNRSPKHYLNHHNSQAVAKSPVRVRIAPPDSSYMPVNNGTFLLQDDEPMKSVLQVLKEISRKRIHSEINDEDEAVKRIRTGDYHESVTPISTESSGQVKRAREDSQPNSGEEIKRRRHFRNNEIHSSLSSSIKVSPYNHGLKRKAYSDDGSRSSSPVLGKLLKVQTSSSPTFVTASSPTCTSLPVSVPAQDDTPQVCKITDSADTLHKESKENLQPLPQDAVTEVGERKTIKLDEVPTNSKSQNSGDSTTGGRRFMGRDICLVNCGKAPVVEKPRREEKVVEESRLNLVPPVNRQKRLTELLRAIDGYSETTATAVVNEKAQPENKSSSSKTTVSSAGILLTPSSNEKTVKSVSFSEPISVTKVISNEAHVPIPSSIANSVSNVDSDSQKELLRIPSALKVENPFSDKQCLPLSTDYATPQFSVQSSSPKQSTTGLFSTPLTNKTAPVAVPITESKQIGAVSNVQTATSSTVIASTASSCVDSPSVSKSGGFSFELKVDKKGTEKLKDMGSFEHKVFKPFKFDGTEDKSILIKPLLFGNKVIKSNVENALGSGSKLGNDKTMTFGATETKKVVYTEENKNENVPTTSVAKLCTPISSLPSTSPPKFTLSSLSSPVTNNTLSFKLPTSISQTNATDVLNQNSPAKKELQLQNTFTTSSDVQKPEQSVVTTIIGNSSRDAVTFKDNKSVNVSTSSATKTDYSQSSINQTFIFNSPVTSASHSTQQLNTTFGSGSKNIFGMAMDKKHSADNKEGFGNIFMNSSNKDAAQGFGNIFNKDSTSAPNTFTKNIFGTVAKEGQIKTDGVISGFGNSNKDMKNKTEFTDGFVRNNTLQSKTEGTGSFSCDKPVTNGFTFTSASPTTVTNSGIFSNVFNMSQLQTTSNTTSTFTTPKFTSTFGSFGVQSSTSSSSSTPTFSFGSTNNAPNTSSVFGNVPTNAFTAAGSGNASNFSGSSQNTFSTAEGKPGLPSAFTFGSSSSSTPTSNFMFGSKQPTTAPETPTFGSSSFKPTENKLFTFGGNSVNQTVGPASGVFTFGQTAGPTTTQPVFQFNSGSNLSSQPSTGPSGPPKSMFSIGTGSTAPRTKSVTRSRRLK